MDPEMAPESTRATWRDRESTNAPAVGEEDQAPSYASAYPELFEKLLQEKVPLRGPTVHALLILLWFVFVSWLFIQDNQAGALATSKGLWWFGMKIVSYTLIAVCAYGALALALRPKSSTDRRRVSSR